MNSLRYFLVIVFSSFLLAGCAGLNHEPPEQFATQFYNNIADNKTTEVIGMFDSAGIADKDRPLITSKLEHAITQMSEQFNARGGIERVEVVKQTSSEDGKQVRLDTIVNFKDGSSKNDSMSLNRTDSGWKIN